MSEELLRDFGTQLKEALSQLSDALGVAAEFVFRVLVKQQIATGITDMLVAFFFIITLTIYLKMYFKRILIPTVRDYDSYSDDEDKERQRKLGWFLNNEAIAIVLGIVGALLLIATLIVVPVNLSSGIKMLINPEYYALKDIMNMIHPPAVVK